MTYKLGIDPSLAAETFGEVERYFAANDNRPRKGDWMQTFTGRQFWPMDPRPDEIFIEDIAHALSMQCRFAGHCLRFYSVAEHSVLLSRAVAPENALWALLHDASEAYLVDIPRPIKPHLAAYKPAEVAVQAAVCERFGLAPEMPAEVHEKDSAIIGDERANMAPCVATWYANGPGIGAHLECWRPEVAEIYFLDTFRKLTGAQGRWSQWGYRATRPEDGFYDDGLVPVGLYGT